MSLVELMIALLIGLLLSAAIITVYLSNKKTFWDTEAAAALQENSRFAATLITDDIRSAGFYADSYAKSVTNIDVGPIASGSCNNLEFNYQQPISGAVTELGCMSGKAYKNGTDILLVKGTRMTPATVFTHSGGSYKTYMVATSFEDSEHYIAQADLDKKAHDSEVHEFFHHVYFISQEEGAVFPQLKRLSQKVNSSGTATVWVTETIADGIEDLHYYFGVDTDNDGAANQYLATEDMSSWDNIVAVKIFMLSQATISDPSFTGGKTYLYGKRTAYTPTDRYHRKLYETTITIRNYKTD